VSFTGFLFAYRQSLLEADGKLLKKANRILHQSDIALKMTLMHRRIITFRLFTLAGQATMEVLE